MSDNFLKKARKSLEDLGGRPRKEDLQIYFLADQKTYFLPVEDGGWDPAPKDLVINYLKRLGFSPNKGTDSVSEINDIIEQTRTMRRVDGVIQSGVLNRGLHIIEGKNGGQQILVTRGPDKIEPEKGEYPVTDWLFNRLFGDQRPWFEGWLQAGVKNLYEEEPPYFSQILCLVGVPRSIKDLLQKSIISEVLGRRSADAYNWLTSKAVKLDSRLCLAMHLSLSLSQVEEKKAFDRLMSVLANEFQECVASRQKLTIEPHWRPSVYLTKDPSSLACLPDLDLNPESQNKLIALDCYPLELDELLTHFSVHDKWTALEDRLGAESPAYLYRLLHEFEAPPELRHQDYNVRGFVAETIARLRWLYSEEGEVYELMREVYFGKTLCKTETEIFRALDESAPRVIVQQFRKNIPGFHSFLEKMAKKFPDQIEYIGERRWNLDFSQ